MTCGDSAFFSNRIFPACFIFLLFDLLRFLNIPFLGVSFTRERRNGSYKRSAER